jgi:hypothetical protein
MSQRPKTVECTDFMKYMMLSTVKDYLGLALSTKDMNITHKCETSLGFVKDALEIVKKLEACFGHGR